jgi:hypothetical protein
MAQLDAEAVPRVTPGETERNRFVEIPRQIPARQSYLPERAGSLVRPIMVAAGISIVALSGGWIATRIFYGDRWIAPYRDALHADTSAIAVPHRDPLEGLRTGEIELTLDDGQGGVIRVAAHRTALREFEKEMLLFLGRKEAIAQQRFEQAVKGAFDQAFADSEVDLAAYASWFFAWERSWILMKESILAGGSELLNLLSPAKVWEAVTARTRGYLMEAYESRVLQPERRNRLIQQGLDAAFHAAHAEYRSAVAELGQREERFIRERTRLLETYPKGSISLKLDWAAQRWRIPAHHAEDRAEQAYRSVAVMGASVGLGPLLAPALGKVAANIINRLAGRVVLARAGQLTGGALAFETLGVSLVIGLAIDWAANKVDERLSRDGFLQEHRRALAETRSDWQQLAIDQLSPVVTRWYRDTRQAVILTPEK